MYIAWRQIYRHLSKRFPVGLWNNGTALSWRCWTLTAGSESVWLFSQHAYVNKIKVLVSFPCGASPCIAWKDWRRWWTQHTVHSRTFYNSDLQCDLKKVKVRWSSCPEPGAYQIMSSSQCCNRAPLWKSLHWISEPAPKHTHNPYLPTFWGTVVSIGSKGIEET